MIEIVVSGAAGRLGSRIAAVCAETAGLAVRSKIDRDDAFEPAKGAVLIETAPRAIAIEHADRARRAGMPILVCTTGFDPAERKALEAAAKDVPLIIAANLSLGVAVLTELVARASAAVPDWALEITEIHHDKKRDAPSGTAWALGRAAAVARDRDIDRDAILARAGDVGPRGHNEIGMQSLRGGDVVGEHTVFFFGAAERLELTHRASNRDVFAHGAARAASFLGDPGRAAGLYTMADVLGLKDER